MQKNIGNVSCNDVHCVGVITTPVSYLLIITYNSADEFLKRKHTKPTNRYILFRKYLKNYVTRMNVNNSFCINN